MTQIIPEIDHAVVTVSDQLDEAKQQYQKLGFTVIKRGHHSLGTSNNLMIFTTTYLELLGYEPQNAHKVDSSWRFDNGLTGLVFKTKDADSLYQQLIKQGVKVDGNGPKSFFRPVELDDGTTSEARFKTVRLDPSYTPKGQIFFCDQLTAHLVWRSEWQEHANGVTNIVRVIIASKNPAHSIELLQRTFPSGQVLEIEGGIRFDANNKYIDYLTPDYLNKIYAQQLPILTDDSDQKVGLTFQTRSIEQVKAVLTSHKIKFIEQDKRIIVSADQTFGVIVEFIQ